MCGHGCAQKYAVKGEAVLDVCSRMRTKVNAVKFVLRMLSFHGALAGRLRETLLHGPTMGENYVK